MNALTVESIITVGSQVQGNLTYHPTTIAYIQTLLTPYAEALEPAQDVESIRQWVPLAFKGELINHALSEMNKAIEAAEANNTDALSAGKVAAIEHLVAEIIEISGNNARQFEATIVLPWDVQASVSDDIELSEMLNITKGDNRLPVTVTIGPQSFTHMLTRDFTVGLLAFSLAAGVDFNITMFETPFSADYFVEDDDKHTGYVYYDGLALQSMFTVDINGKTYTFITPDFMQGFATGASWSGVDHHVYWSELTRHFNEAGDPQITKLTF